MKLRRELMPPKLDRRLVAHLTRLAEQIDCGDREETWAAVLVFNRRAGTDYGFLDFQGIYGAQEHVEWVRSVLGEKYERRLPDITREELVELARRVMRCAGREHAMGFWLSMLELNVPDGNVSDLIFWPQIYFNDPDFAHDLSAEQVVDIALMGAGPDGNGLAVGALELR